MTRKITATAAVLALLATGCSASTDSSAPGGTLITGGTSTATSTPTPSPTTPATATTTAGRTPTVAEVTASPSAEASTTAASTTAAATPTPTVSLDPSPLAGTGGGPQQPSSVPTLNSITDEDRGRALDEDRGRALEAAKAIVAAYTSGKPYKEWSEELYPMIDPKLQNQYGPNSRIDIFKGTVTNAELVDDPTLKVPGGDNPYWLTVCVKVEGSISPAYYVRLHRTAERPDKWKASHILEPQGFNSFVKERLKE